MLTYTYKLLKPALLDSNYSSLLCYDGIINEWIRRMPLMGTVIIISIIIFIIVLALTIFTINKGYAFKHTIDERPEMIEDKKKTHPPD